MKLIDKCLFESFDLRRNNFEKRLISYEGHIKGQQGFGSQQEKSVHAFLKSFYSLSKNNEEVMLEGFICDICCDNDIIEIQSKAFYRLHDKLNVLLQNYRVMVVYPIICKKEIEWLDPVTKALVSRNKSSKRTGIYSFLPEVYGLRDLIGHPNLYFGICEIEATETKLLDGYGPYKKSKATKVDKYPTKYVNEVFISDVNDFMMFVPETLEEFDVDLYAKTTHLSKADAGTALTLLNKLGIIEHFDTRNRKYIYRIME